MSVKYSKKYIKYKKERLNLLKKVKENFFDTVPKNIHYRSQHEVIFTLQFLKLLKDSLPSADGFLKMTMADRKKIAEIINNLCLVESGWKTLVSKLYYEQRYVNQMFPKELQKFKKYFAHYFFPTESSTNLNKIKKHPNHKTIAFFKGFFTYLQKEKKNIPFLKNFSFKKISSSRLDELAIQFSKDIDSGYFFKEILKICMKKAHDNIINVETASNVYNNRRLPNLFLYVKRTHIIYPLQKVIVLYFCVVLIEGLKKENSSLKVNADRKVLLFFENFITKNEECLMKQHSWYRDTYNIALFYLSIFAKSGIVVKEETTKISKGDKHTSIVYWLKHDLEHTIPFSYHIPRIIPPKTFDKTTDIKRFIAPYIRGEFSVSPSELTIKVLNIAQKKVFKVNYIYLHFLDEIHNTPDYLAKILKNRMPEKGNTSFPTVAEIENKFNTYSTLDSSLSVNALQRYINKEAVIDLLSKRKKKETIHVSSLFIADVTQVESNLNYKKSLTWREFSIAKARRQLMQTSIIIAEIFKDFPIYYGTKLDFRTRMYPWEYLLSRTTGELKQLLCDFYPHKLTEDGLLSLMCAYYNFSLEINFAWHKFLCCHSFSKYTIWESAKKFFEEHNIEESPELFDCDNNVAYVLTLHANISNVFFDKNSEVDVMLEIDQVASGIMLLSMLLGVKSLAEEANVLGGEPKDIYRYLMRHTKDFFEKYIQESDKLPNNEKKQYNEIVSFLCTNRKCAKDILMKWAYSQGELKRREDIANFFKEYSNRNLRDFEYTLVLKFAKNYDKFLETLFPNIKKQKSFFFQVLEIRKNSSSNIQGMNIRTVDGTDLAWGITSFETITKGVWDPIANKSYNVTLNVKKSENKLDVEEPENKLDVEEPENKLDVEEPENKSDVEELKNKSNKKDLYFRGLFPNLIHSIDASIMRIIIFRVHERTSYQIGHLHDCILCHPNAVTSVFEVITEIYTDGTLKDLADKTFFTPMQEGLNEKDKMEIQKLKEQFDANSDYFEVNQDNFVAENCYTFEGSVKRDVLHTRMKTIGLEPIQLLRIGRR